MTEKKPWQIGVDTGGTFTDCVARSPDGEMHRAKVLSSGTLRGQVVTVTGPETMQVISLPGTVPDLFTGYTLRFLSVANAAFTIAGYDPDTNRITLNQPLPYGISGGADFEITAGEEAPVLAARLVTDTPLNSPLPPLQMRLGSTKGTNALLERKGARVGLLITKGFAGLPEIGTQQRPDLFALHVRKPPLLCSQVLEVAERLDAAGGVLTPLSGAELDRIAEAVKETGIRVWAVALLHSYRNPVHEVQLKDRLQREGIFSVSLSSELMPAIKLLPRAQTAVVNAYLAPVMQAYLEAVAEKLPPQSTLRVMTSAGGLVSASLFAPKDSLLSGPAGGVVGAAAVARLSGITKMLTLDMGGTSTDVARYDGNYDYRYDLRVGDAHLQSRALAIETVAAGGGSVCTSDGIRLTVGPESAGARPGPACYGLGGPLTITDVNLLLGRVDPGNFGIPLNFAAAEGALREIRDKLAGTGSQTDERLLSGFLQIANERMAGAIRQISVLKGYDPSEYTLLAFGGAGGQHACQVAELLKMTSVLIPPDAGLLSAYGMGQAVIERFSTRQVLRPLDEVEGQLNQMLNDLTLQAQDALSAEGFPPEETQVGRQSLFLRFKGQDASIEIPFSPGTAPAEAFRWQYEALYGHWIGNRELELESAKVIVTTRPALQTLPEKKGRDYSPVPYNTQRCFTAGEWQQTPVFRWQDLKPGAVIAGPALIVSPTSTTLAEPGWTFRTDAAGNGVMARTKNQEETEPAELSDATEAVQLALFTNRFTAIAAEMGALLERTAFSVNVKERLDFSCAVLDTDGYLVVNAPHIPVHLGSLGICVRSVMAALPLEDGDVAITNHPGFGGSHLPDITLISPVHDEAGRRIGFVANRAHHAEIGGKRPGSMPPDARNLAEEGIVISPTWLVRRGEARWEEITSQLTTAHYPSRALAENLADLQAALAAIRSGKTALQNLCRAYGARRVGHYMQELKKYAATSLLRRIGSMPRGDYPAEELLDDGSKIKVQVTVSPSRLRISFAGTSGTHPHNLNATPAIVNSAVMYVLRLLIDEDIPLNEGLMEAVDLHLPEGLLNPGFPEDPQKCPAVVGGNTETSQRVVDTLLKALGLAACSQGTMNNVVFGNATFGYYETIGGGTGAGHGFNGASAVHQHMTNTRITDPEVMEFRYPVRLEQFAVRKDSGGAGQWKGGDGILRELRFLEPVSLTVLAEHRWTAPYGLSGGEPGQPGRQYIIRKDGATQELSGSAGAEMTPGDRFVIETPGGGGFGCE